MSETIPVVTDLDEPESDDVTVLIEVDNPSDDQLLRLYEIYRKGGGKAYEPYESMLEARSHQAA